MFVIVYVGNVYKQHNFIHVFVMFLSSDRGNTDIFTRVFLTLWNNFRPYSYHHYCWPSSGFHYYIGYYWCRASSSFHYYAAVVVASTTGAGLVVASTTVLQ